MTKETVKAIGWGAIVTLALAGLIVLGSRNLAHFDAALVGYTFAVLFAALGITYRYAMWPRLRLVCLAMIYKSGSQPTQKGRIITKNSAAAT